MASGTVPGAPPFDTLTNALGQAVAGDIISVDPSYGRTSGPPPGTEYVQITKTNTGAPIVIQSSSIASLPAGTRVTPANASLMPLLSANPNGAPNNTLSTLTLFNIGNGPPSGYTFRGFEITNPTAANQSYYALVRVDGTINQASGTGTGDSTSQSTSQIPNNIVFDRCYIHGQDNNELRIGMRLGCGTITITECYISNVKTSGSVESHAVWITNATGPITINNCYLEAVSQCFFSGGDTGTSSSLINTVGGSACPSGTVQNCTLSKDLRLTPQTAAAFGLTPLLPTLNSTWLFKNIMEFKVGQNWTVQQNLFQYSFVTQQNAEAIVLNFSEYYSSNNSRMAHMHFINNIIDSVGAVATFATEGLGAANGGEYATFRMLPSQTLTDIVFQNNHVTNWGWRYSQPYSSSNNFNGQTAAFRIVTGRVGATINIDHNTIIPDSQPVSNSFAFLLDSGTQYDSSASTVAAPTVKNSILTNNASWEAVFGYDLIPDGNSAFPDNVSTFNTWKDNTYIVAGNAIASSSVSQTGSSNFLNAFVLTSNNYPTTATFAAPSVASGLALTTVPRSFTNFGRNGGQVSLTLYQVTSGTPGFGLAYTGAGTTGTSYVNPGADLSKLTIGSTITLTNTTTLVAPQTGAWPSELAVTVLVQSQTQGAGTPGGTVSLFLNGQFAGSMALNSAGQAVFVLVWPPPGNHTLQASYAGGGNFNPSSSPVTPWTVAGAPTSVHLVATPNPDPAGTQVTVTANVTSP